MKIIYVDMDGVTSNFDLAWLHYHGYAKGAQIGLSRKQKDEHWAEFVASGQFAGFPMMPKTQRLLDMLHQIDPAVATIKILSSGGGRKDNDHVVEQKKVWLQKHGIDWEPIIVPGKRFKKDYANADAFLIDDHSENVDEFIANGGHAFLYKDSDDENYTELLKQLNTFLGQPEG